MQTSELIAELQTLPSDLEVEALFDTREREGEYIEEGELLDITHCGVVSGRVVIRVEVKV